MHCLVGSQFGPCVYGSIHIAACVRGSKRWNVLETSRLALAVLFSKYRLISPVTVSETCY